MNDLVTYSQIQPLVQSGRYHEAITLYQKLDITQPIEDRLIGHAYWGLGDFLNAEAYLQRAFKRDDYGAIVDLLQIDIVQNKVIDIEKRFKKVDPKRLSIKEHLQLFYLHGEHLFRSNKLVQAESILKEAWVKARSSSEIGSLEQSIAQSLAFILHIRGQDAEAIRIVDSSLPQASTIWSTFLKTTKCKIFVYSGKYTLAKEILLELDKVDIRNLQIELVKSEVLGILKYVEQDSAASMKILSDMIRTFKSESEDKSSLCRAFFTLIGILISIKDWNLVRSQMIKFELVISVTSEKALFNHRKGQYHNALGEYDNAVIYLEQARETFFNLEWRRELGWTLLQLAYAHAKLGNSEKASVILDSLSDIVSITESAAFLELEKRFIGDLSPLTAVASSYGMLAFQALGTPLQPIISRPAPDLITFHSFGNSTLSLNGQPISCKLHRSFAVMAYLLMYPHSPLEKIITDVFEDSKDVEAARNYFHTARFELSRALPCVKFAFDKFTKTYAVDAGTIPIEFDYLQTMQLLHAPTENDFYLALEIYRGPFMRGFEGQWIEEVRENVEWLLVRSGLKLVQEMYETGDYQACRRLTERLLKVEPLDESLNELLVRATREVEGALASRKAMSKVESQFLHEVGELPPTLAQLKSEMKFRMN